MNLNINTIFQNSFPYWIALLSGFVLANLVFFILPKSGIEKSDMNLLELDYNNYGGFYSQSSFKEKPTISRPVQKQKAVNIQTKYQLKAIYSTSSNKGWVIIREKSNDKTIILEHMESLKGYTLTSLFKSYVIFEKNNQEYKMSLAGQKEIKYEISKQIDYGNESISVEDDKVSIQRSYLNSHVQDLSKVWKNINIQEIKEGNKIKGFKVLKINQGSIFNKLGLKKDDLIQSINKKQIRSYADIFKVFNRINKTNYLSLTVLRDNEEVELYYEID